MRYFLAFCRKKITCFLPNCKRISFSWDLDQNVHSKVPFPTVLLMLCHRNRGRKRRPGAWTRVFENEKCECTVLFDWWRRTLELINLQRKSWKKCSILLPNTFIGPPPPSGTSTKIKLNRQLTFADTCCLMLTWCGLVWTYVDTCRYLSKNVEFCAIFVDMCR